MGVKDVKRSRGELGGLHLCRKRDEHWTGILVR